MCTLCRIIHYKIFSFFKRITSDSCSRFSLKSSFPYTSLAAKVLEIILIHRIIYVRRSIRCQKIIWYNLPSR